MDSFLRTHRNPSAAGHRCVRAGVRGDSSIKGPKPQAQTALWAMVVVLPPSDGGDGGTGTIGRGNIDPLKLHDNKIPSATLHQTFGIWLPVSWKSVIGALLNFLLPLCSSFALALGLY